MFIITCNVNIFDLEQTVYKVNTETNEVTVLGRATFDNLDHFITTLCDKENIDVVKLGGVSAYAVKLKDRIEAESVARYKKGIQVDIL